MRRFFFSALTGRKTPFLCLAFFAIASVSRAANPAKTDPAAKAHPFGWSFTRGEILVYDFDQRVEVKITGGNSQAKPPLQVRGSVEIVPRSADSARMMLVAQKKGGAPPAQVHEFPTAPVSANEDKGSSCSCRRAGSKPENRVLPPQSAPAPARHVNALFELRKDGSIEGSRATAGGQTELMVRLLMPLPLKPLAPGQTEQAELHVDGIGGRFPMSGTQVLTYKEDRVVDGRRLAVLTTQVGMRGSADPAVAKMPAGSGKLDGNMELTAQGELLFDTETGRLVSARSDLTFQLNTARNVGGVKKAVSLEQKAHTTLSFAQVKKAPGPASPSLKHSASPSAAHPASQPAVGSH